MLRSNHLPYLLLCVLAFAHRCALFASLHGDFDFLLSLMPEAWTWQHLPVSVLKDHLLAGLWYLQQNPPLPQLLLGLVVKFAGIPYGVAHMLLVLQAVVSTISALLLYGLLLQLRISRLLAFVVAAVFLLSADLILLEYNSFGQTIYENLCMPLLMGAVWALFRFMAGRERKYLLYLGLLVAMLALTRASFGYFFLPVAIFLAALKIRRKELLIFLLPVILLQGGWAAKNLYLYRYFSLPATSWTGANLLAGIYKRGGAQDEAVASHIVRHPELYPSWFVDLTRREGLIYWAALRAEPYVPARVRAMDAEVAARLPGNPEANTMAQAAVANLYKKAVLHYALENPRRFLQGALQSYRQFWLPIREYPGQFSSLLFVAKSSVTVWSEAGGAGFLEGGYEDGNFRVLQRLRHPFFGKDIQNLNGTKPGSPLALPYAAFVMYVFNIAAIHGLGPLLLLVLFLYRRDIGLDRRQLVFLYLAYVYVATVSAIGDHGENNRFRLAVEPVIWLLSVFVAVGWWRLLRGAGFFRAASPPAAQCRSTSTPSAPGSS